MSLFDEIAALSKGMPDRRTVDFILTMMVANADTGAAEGCACCRERRGDLETLQRAIKLVYGEPS